MDLLRELARISLADRPLHDVLTEIARVATGGIPGAESTSITLVRNDKAFTAAHHGEMALAADELQYAKGYGPCMDAGRGGVVLRIDDVRTELRWPDHVAHATGGRSPQLTVGAAALPGVEHRGAEHLLHEARRLRHAAGT